MFILPYGILPFPFPSFPSPSPSIPLYFPSCNHLFIFPSYIPSPLHLLSSFFYSFFHFSGFHSFSRPSLISFPSLQSSPQDIVKHSPLGNSIVLFATFLVFGSNTRLWCLRIENKKLGEYKHVSMLFTDFIILPYKVQVVHIP